MKENLFKIIHTEEGGKIKLTEKEQKLHKKMLENREKIKESEKPKKYAVKEEITEEKLEKIKKDLEKEMSGIEFYR